MKIALCGYARSGKDTVAAYLVVHYAFVRFAFADEMKRYAYEIFGAPEDGKKPRDLLQFFGETMRLRDEKVWVRKMFDNIERYGREWKLPFNVVVTDLRLPVEYEALREQGYVFIRVNATSGARIGRMVAEGDAFNLDSLTHETERYIDTFQCEYELYNDGGFTALYQQIDYVMADIKAKQKKA